MKNQKGFTLIELLVVIAVIGMLVSIISLTLQQSRKKAIDAKTQQSLSQVRSSIEQAQPASVSYDTALSSGAPSRLLLDQLVSSLNLSSSEYSAEATPNEYAIVIPMQSKPKWWCVDSRGQSKEVDGLLLPSGPRDCDNTGVPGDPDLTATLSPTSITLNGPNSSSVISFNIINSGTTSSTGTITVRVPNVSGHTISTSNSSWTYSSASGFTTFISNGFSIPQGQTRVLPITITKNAGNYNISNPFLFSPRIRNPSGNEINTANNLPVPASVTVTSQ